MAGPISGLMAAPAVSTSHSLTQNRTKSTGADRGGIVGGLGGLHQGFASAALDAQAVLAHGRQMGAAGDEGDVGAGFGQGSPEGAANSAGTDDGYAHGSNSVSFLGIRS